MFPIKVTCAIILFGSKTLVVQRGAAMSMPFKWEFPGGKLEAGETEEACIKREIREELNIEIELLARLTPALHHYPDFSVELLPFLARHKAGDLKLLEHKQYLLLDINDLSALDWAEADVPIVEEYLKLPL